MKLSICIPTYNRAVHLANCLNSIILCNSQAEYNFQVCVSDNHSTDETEKVVRDAQAFIEIKYHKNSYNIGIPRNFLNVVSIAEGDFVWLIGDDDLLIPNAIADIYKFFEANQRVDFIYANSYHLHVEYLKRYPVPFDTVNLPGDMVPFSKWQVDGEMKFLDMISPQISFDFLGGMYLSIFRKSLWDQNVNQLDQHAIMDDRTFSHFDNTFPHLKIFAKAFSNSKAYFNSKPLSVCLTGVREWAPMYPLIRSVRLVEALSIYRNNGLALWKYLDCKNYALRNALPDFINIVLHKDQSGYSYVNFFKLSLEYGMYPNFYLSIFYFLGRRLRIFFRGLYTLITN